jgi:hypothetical protein
MFDLLPSYLGYVQSIDLTPFFRGISFCQNGASRTSGKSARGILKVELFITGDIMSPIDVGREALSSAKR